MTGTTLTDDRLFHALADATRRDIVRRTLVEELSVSNLAQGYPMSFAAVQKHVAVLERAGAVHKRRCGREQLVRGNVVALRDAARVLRTSRTCGAVGSTASPTCSNQPPNQTPESATRQERP